MVRTRMSWRDRLTNLLLPERQSISFDDWLSYFQFGNFSPSMSWSADETVERIETNFAGYVTGAYQANGIVFACEMARLRIFSQARFAFREIRDGRPGDVFMTPALDILNQPWQGGTTADLLSKVLLMADFGGTGFIIRRYGELIVPRPDWMHIIAGSMERSPPGATIEDLHADIVGFIYHPGGEHSGNEPVTLLPEEVAYFAPTPSPLAKWKGMPWLLPALREIIGDSAAAMHKVTFLQKAATPNMVITFDPNIARDKAEAWIDKFRKEHEGAANAYRTLFLGGGALKADVVGANLRQMDFKQVQAAGEVRIAAAAGIHPVLIGISESLSGSSLNSGNFGAAREMASDILFRSMWQNICGSLAHLIDVPAGAELWYDESQVPFLRKSVNDQVAILRAQMAAINTGLVSGFTADNVVDAVVSGDLNRLKGNHTGLLSVQLQPPISESSEAEPAPRMIGWMPAPQLPAKAGGEVRCEGCNRFLAELATPPYRLRCRDCKAITTAA